MTTTRYEVTRRLGTFVSKACGRMNTDELAAIPGDILIDATPSPVAHMAADGWMIGTVESTGAVCPFHPDEPGHVKPLD